MASGPVPSTERIFYDDDFRTFRLYAGNSLYAFCISPENELEHLYWGMTLHPSYDLRYVGNSSRMSCFSTLEDAVQSKTVAEEAAKTLLAATDINDLSIKDITFNKFHEKSKKDDLELYEKRRLENFKWRKQGILEQTGRPYEERIDEDDDEEGKKPTRVSSRSDPPPVLGMQSLQNIKSKSSNILANMVHESGNFENGTYHTHIDTSPLCSSLPYI